MIMPFIRLLTIYALVIITVLAFFKRDSLMQFSSATFGWPASEAAPQQEPEQSAETSTETSTGTSTGTSPATEPAPQTSKASLPAIQMPVADPEEKANTPKIAPTSVAVAQPTADKPASDDTKTRLKAARQAYWNGYMDGARALYAALAKAAPNDPDVNGEFGNILFAQRQFDAAADAYLVTGRLLVKNGQNQQVQPIIAVLQNIAPKKAATLRALANN
jgi:cytoskeletal protein RodZ